jgi:serine/threonine protein kinase
MNSENEQSCPKCGATIPALAPQGLCPKCVMQAVVEPSDEAAVSKRRPVPPSVEAVAAAFPELEVMELIGAGGMGSVYKARQPKLNRLVALKILYLDLAADPAFAERFNREAQMLGLLNHANIVAIYDFGKQAEFFFLLMEFVDGVNLRQAMQAGSFSPTEALAVVPEICAALQYAHDEGVMHRDIKPENILIDTRGRVKIADFGIAKMVGDKQESLNLTVSGAVMGTPTYMAPEQLENTGEVDHRADIYSLGVVFYELLTGELPIGRFEAPSERVPMDSRVDDVVLRTLEKQREKRYQSAGALKTSVEEITQTPAGNQPTERLGSQSRSDSISPKIGTARGATAAAVLTTLSLPLAIPLLLALTMMSPGTSQEPSQGSPPFLWLAGTFVPPIASGLIGFILGLSALRKIRESAGKLGGLTRALLGTLLWLLMLLMLVTGLTVGIGVFELSGKFFLSLGFAGLAMLIVSEILLIAVWRWAKCLSERRGTQPFWNSEQITMSVVGGVLLLIPILALVVLVGGYFYKSDFVVTPSGKEGTPEVRTDFFVNSPAIDLALTLPADHVAIIGLVRNRGSEVIESNPFRGFVMAADNDSWDGRVRLQTNAGIRNGLQQWTINLVGSNDEHGITGRLSSHWIFETSHLPKTLDLSRQSSHLLRLTTPAGEAVPGVTPGETLSLRIRSRPRTGPGVPTVKLRSPEIDAGSTNWVEHLKQLGKQ